MLAHKISNTVSGDWGYTPEQIESAVINGIGDRPEQYNFWISEYVRDHAWHVIITAPNGFERKATFKCMNEQEPEYVRRRINELMNAG
jgi:hypothetical protein